MSIGGIRWWPHEFIETLAVCVLIANLAGENNRTTFTCVWEKNDECDGAHWSRMIMCCFVIMTRVVSETRAAMEIGQVLHPHIESFVSCGWVVE